jgi:hypothetical protein
MGWNFVCNPNGISENRILKRIFGSGKEKVTRVTIVKP